MDQLWFKWENVCYYVQLFQTTKVQMLILPLTVDYREKFAAAGKYPGGFFKREARPSSDEILDNETC